MNKKNKQTRENDILRHKIKIDVEINSESEETSKLRMHLLKQLEIAGE